jgi:hypothetical protein
MARCVQSASLPEVLLVLRMCMQAERMDFAAVASTLAQYPDDARVWCKGFTAIACCVFDDPRARSAALSSGALELAIAALARHSCSFSVVRSATCLIRNLSYGDELRAINAGVVGVLIDVLGRQLAAVPSARNVEDDTRCLQHCVWALHDVCTPSLMKNDTRQPCATSVGDAARARAAARATGAPAACFAALRLTMQIDDAVVHAEALPVIGRILRALLADDDAWEQATRHGGGKVLLDAVVLMRERGGCATTQKWVIRNVLLPLTAHEMQRRRRGGFKQGFTSCTGICCVWRGAGAPCTLAALHATHALSAVVDVLQLHPDAHVPAARLLACVVQSDEGARRAMREADADGELLRALLAARASAAAATADAEAARDDDDDDDDDDNDADGDSDADDRGSVRYRCRRTVLLLDAALRALTGARTNVEPAAAAEAYLARAAAAERAFTSLLAEEECAASERAAAAPAATAPKAKKPGSRARRAAAAKAVAAAAAQEDADDGDEEQEEAPLDEVAMAMALRGNHRGSGGAEAGTASVAQAPPEAVMAALTLQPRSDLLSPLTAPAASATSAAAALPVAPHSSDAAAAEPATSVLPPMPPMPMPLLPPPMPSAQLLRPLLLAAASAPPAAPPQRRFPLPKPRGGAPAAQ